MPSNVDKFDCVFNKYVKQNNNNKVTIQMDIMLYYIVGTTGGCLFVIWYKYYPACVYYPMGLHIIIVWWYAGISKMWTHCIMYGTTVVLSIKTFSDASINGRLCKCGIQSYIYNRIIDITCVLSFFFFFFCFLTFHKRDRPTDNISWVRLAFLAYLCWGDLKICVYNIPTTYMLLYGYYFIFFFSIDICIIFGIPN